jgi:hypothetical protein
VTPVAGRKIIPVYLDPDEYQQLDALAYAASRIPEQQASHMLRQAIARTARATAVRTPKTRALALSGPTGAA